MYELLGDEKHWFFTMELIRNGANFMDHLRGPSSDPGGISPYGRVHSAILRQPSSDAATVAAHSIAHAPATVGAPSRGPADLTQATLASAALCTPASSPVHSPHHPGRASPAPRRTSCAPSSDGVPEKRMTLCLS